MIRNARIRVRLSKQENALLNKKAEIEGMNASQFLRQKISDGIQDDEVFNQALDTLLKKMNIEGEKVNQAALNARMNGANQSHVKIAKEVMRKQIEYIQDFEKEWF